MATWHEITRDPEYQELSEQGKALVKQGFFEREISSDPEFKAFSPQTQKAVFDDFWQTPDDTGQGIVTSTLGSAIRGAGEIVPGTLQGVGALTGITPISDLGESARAGLEYVAPVNPIYEQGIPAKVANVAGNVASIIGTSGVGGLAGKVLGAERAAAAGSAAARQALTNQAIQAGAKSALYGTGFAQGAAAKAEENKRLGITGAEGYLNLLGGGVSELAPEMLPFGTALESAAARRLLGGVDDASGRVIPGIRMSAAQEAAEGGSTQVLSNLSTQLTAPTGVEAPGLFEGAGEAALWEGVGGAMFGAINKLGRTPPENQTDEQRAYAAELGAVPVDSSPPITPEESLENFNQGGIPVVSPDGVVTTLPFNREDIRATDLPFNREDIRASELPFTREDIRPTQLPFNREDIRSTELPFSRQNIRGLSQLGQPAISPGLTAAVQTADSIVTTAVDTSPDVSKAAEATRNLINGVVANEQNAQAAIPQEPISGQVMPESRQLPVVSEQPPAQAPEAPTQLPVETPISDSPSQNLTPRADYPVEPRPVRKGRDTSERDAWDVQFGNMRNGGRTHNDDGTPYQPTVFDEVATQVMSARQGMTDEEATNAIGDLSETSISTSLRTLIDAGWTWNPQEKRMVPPLGSDPNESPLRAILRLQSGTQTPSPTQEQPEIQPQPIETATDAIIQREIPENRVEERLQTDEGGPSAAPSSGNRFIEGGQIQEEVAPPITPQGTPTPATEGTVMPGGSAIERDVTKPEQMTPEEFIPVGNPVNLGIFKSKKEASARLTELEDSISKSPQMLGILSEFNLIPGDAYQVAKDARGRWTVGATHKHRIALASRENRPVSAAAVDAYKITLPEGYVRQGDLYVFSPQTTTVAKPTETAAPSAKEAAVASVVQQPVDGSIPTVEQESAINAIESTEKTDVAEVDGEAQPPVLDPVGYGNALISLFPSLKKAGVQAITVEEAMERLDAEWQKKKASGKATRLDQLVYMANKKNTQSALEGGDIGGLWTRSDKTVAVSNKATPSSMAHEIGHAIMELEYVNAPEATKKAIEAEYTKWFKSKYGSDGVPSVADQRRIWEWMTDADWMNPDAPFPQEQRVSQWEAYRSKFSEWFADETAKWAATRDAPKSLVDKFFSELAQKLKKLWDSVRGSFSPNETLASWLDSISVASPAKDQPTIVETDVAKEAMRFLEADLTDAQRAKWTPEMFTAAQAFFDSGGKDFDSLKKAIKFPRVVQQAYLKADKEAAAEQTRREAADAALAREVEKAEKEQAKLEADQKQREELGLKTLNSLIEKTRTNVVQGSVKSSDANQAVAILNKSGAIPNVLFTWIGTSKDFLADPANRARYPETWKAVSSNPNIEGMSENGQPIVFTDNVGVSDLDRNLAKLQGTTPEVAAVRRVILHENIHKGMFFLSLKDKMKLFQFLHRLYSPEELDQLAKSYDEYSDWRINQVSYFSIIEEAMTRDFDSMAEIPRDGIWAEFMQFLRDIWQKITGKTSEPTLKNYKDVFRLIRNSLKNSEASNADRLKNGGEVRMSMSEFISNVTPEQDAAYAKAVADGDMATAQRMVDEAAFENGLEEWFHGNTKSFGGFSSTDLGVHFGTEDAAKDRLDQTGQISGVVNKYYVDIKNPVKLKYDPDTWQALDVWQALPKDIKDKVENSYEYVIQDLELGELKTELQKLGFDGIKYRNAFEGVGDSILVFDKEQIKSADPVTYDNAGNIIPLSRRFQSASNDIRFSKVEYDSPNEAAFNSGAKYETNDTSVRPYASQGYGSQRMEGVSTGDNSPRAQAIRKAVSESNWNELSPTQRAKALEEFGLQSIQSRYSFDTAILPVRVTNERTPKNRPASILSAGLSPAITIQFDTSGLADLLSGDAVTAFANIFDMAQEEVIHAAQHLNIYNRWKSSNSTDSVGLYELKYYTSMINEVAKIAGDELRSGNPAVANIFTNAWNLYNPNDQASDVNDAISKIKSAPEAAAFAMELSRMMLQMQRQDFTTETGWMRFVEEMKAMLADITNALRTALAMAKNGQVGKRLQDEISEVNALINDLESASQPMASKVEYDSPNEAAFNSGAEVARNADYDERDKAVRSTIRAAYDLAPKPNGPSVPLDQLFDIAKQSMPDLTEGEFSQILQDLYEDSGALLQAGESPFIVTTPDGQRAGSVIIVSSLPTGAMASIVDSPATNEFTQSVDDINNGTAKAAFSGRQFKDFKPIDRTVKSAEEYSDVAIKYVNNLEKEGVSLEDIANSVISPVFLESIGIEQDLMAQDALTIEVRQRVDNASRKEKSPGRKKQLSKLSERLSAFWQGVGSKKGQHLGQRRYLVNKARYSWMFIRELAEKAMKEARTNILISNFGSENATSFTQNSYENADMASTISEDEVAKDTINDTEWDLIKEGEQVFDGARKTIWERVKFLVAQLALFARAEAAEIKSASKASFTDAQRDELAAILTMPKAEREKAKAKVLAELDSLMAKLLGEESPTDTPTEKKKRNKRKEIIETVEKRVKAGEPIEAPEEVGTSEDEVTKAEATAQAILKDLSERYSDPIIFKDKKPNINEMRELYKERVKQGNGASQMTEETFVNKAIELGADEKTAGILWSAAELEIDAREAMRQDKIRQRNAAAGERADAQAHRIIFAKERLKRQSGFADIDTNPNKDTIIKAFREQVKTPIAIDAFIQRLIPLKVSRQVAERLFMAAERENTDLAAMAVYDRTQGPKALKRMISEINLMRRGEEIPLRTPIPWRKLLSQKAKTVEEYRQRIFDAISANEELKSATPEQKARLADLFAEAWEANRTRILDGMLERMIRAEEAKKNLSKEGAKALQEQRMRIVEDINLGIFDNDELAKRMAEKFGIKSEFTEMEREKINSLIEVLQDEGLNAVKRQVAAYKLLEVLQGELKIPVAKMLADFWVSSVLSGPNTIASIGLAVASGAFELSTALSRVFIAGFTNQKQLPSELAGAYKTLARLLSAFGRQANIAWQYLVTGDPAFLDPSMNDVTENMQWGNIGKSNKLAEQMAKSDKILAKSAGLFMRTVSRLLTALDVFNSGLTKEGSLSIVFRQIGLDPEKIAALEKKSDLKPYKDAIIQKDFGGTPPKSARDKAIVDSYALSDMMAELDKLGNVSENANFFGQQGAMTLDPSGLGGVGYRAIRSLVTNFESGSDRFLKKAQRGWSDSAQNGDQILSGLELAFAYALQFLAYNAANFGGVRFARFAGNKFNQGLSFIPGIGFARAFEAEFDPDRIRAKEAFIDSIQRNQLVGVILSIGGYYILKAIADEPDDEKRGWFINGGWGNLTPEKKQQKLAAGEKEYTIGINGKVFNYANWPISSALAAIGSLSDLIRFSPDQWNDKNVTQIMASAAMSGAAAAADIPALSQFQELFGNSLSSKDPNEKRMERFAKVMSSYAGGFVPRFLKDIDYAQDPNLRKYETLWEKTASHIPVYRRYEGKEYYDILGQQIQRNVYPGSREFMVKPTDPAYRVLGALNSRGIWLTPANAEHRMVGKGARRRSLTQEEADNYSLETGKGYKQMLLRYGQRALQMPTERARAFLLDKADEVRDRALKKVYRGYQPAT